MAAATSALNTRHGIQDHRKQHQLAQGSRSAKMELVAKPAYQLYLTVLNPASSKLRETMDAAKLQAQRARLAARQAQEAVIAEVAATRSVDTITQPDIDAGEEKLRLAKVALTALTKRRARLTQQPQEQAQIDFKTALGTAYDDYQATTAEPLRSYQLTSGKIEADRRLTYRAVDQICKASCDRIEQEYNEAREQRQVVWNDYLNSIKAASAA
ncbi:MAG: hypothetical protein IPL73_06520 [Candidatus Obscuribacter sp.]|nr:hypothetical protein [Candidatus Obscuribacter sp.]